MLHIAEDYAREHGRRPLSTITQFIYATYQLRTINDKMLKGIKTTLLISFSSLVFQGCLDLRSCDKDISGKYYSKGDDNTINYLDINKDGTYYHFCKKNDIELINKGTWEKSSDSYCKIKLKNWKNFNEMGVYQEFIFGLLYINGDYLDLTQDGTSSTSFKREDS